MARLNDLSRRPDGGPVVNSSASAKMKVPKTFGQRSLDEVAGEPLAGSGFENEEPESEFVPAKEES